MNKINEIVNIKDIIYIIRGKKNDRFIIIDREKIYHLGCSLKDLENKCFVINLIQDKK